MGSGSFGFERLTGFTASAVSVAFLNVAQKTRPSLEPCLLSGRINSLLWADYRAGGYGGYRAPKPALCHRLKRSACKLEEMAYLVQA